MGLLSLVPVALLIAASGAYDIYTDENVLLRNGWLTYAKTTSLPMCCDANDSSCKMVRLSSQLYAKVKNNGKKLRFSLKSSEGRMNAILSFNNGDLSGKVYQNDGTSWTLETIPASEATDRSSKCYKSSYANSRQYYYRIKFHAKMTSGNLPSLLVDASADDASASCNQCYGSFCKSVTKINSNALKADNDGNVPDIYVPRADKPDADLDEVFTLSGTQPEKCRPFCDVYMYSNEIGEMITISKQKGNSWSLRLEDIMGEGLTLKNCGAGQILTGQKGVQTTIPLTAAAGKVAPGDLCWYPNYICEPNYHTKSWFALELDPLKNDEDYVTECYNAYVECVECSHFTYVNLRDGPYCYLQVDCKIEYDTECFEKGKCKSGPTNCEPIDPNANCTSPPDLGPDFQKWQCTDRKANRLGPVQPYAPLASGTVCLMGCGSWLSEGSTAENPIAGYLYAQCQNNGEWTTVTSVSGEASLQFPVAPYPLPDAGIGEVPAPLSCGCPELTLTYNGQIYNPNDEAGATLQCTDPESDFVPGVGFVIKSGNVCYLMCDNVLAVTIMCNEDGWTGQPLEYGVYCYVAPGVHEQVSPGNCTCGLTRENRVVGGEETKVNNYLWMVGIIHTPSEITYCGGSLIANRFVLTAAHCVAPFHQSIIITSLGEHNLHVYGETEVETIWLEVENVIIHEEYSFPANDIALIVLKEEVDLSIYNTVCLPEENENFAGQNARDKGWGSLEFLSGDYPDTLQKVDLPVKSLEECLEQWPQAVEAKMLCAGGIEGEGACNGDSGGPLSIQVDGRHKVIGIVSGGAGCAAENEFTFYAEVSKFIPWIFAKMAENGDYIMCPA